MKRWYHFAALAIGAAVAIPSLTMTHANAQPAAETPAVRPQRSISVVGEGRVLVEPDEAIVKLGIETRNLNLTALMQQHRQQVGQLLSLVRNLGVPETNVRTTYIDVEPRYRNFDSADLETYAASTTISVQLTDLTKLENLLVGALGQGANRIDDIEFQTSQLDIHRSAARALAVEAARSKAQEIAEELGVQVGSPLTVVEESDRGFPVVLSRSSSDVLEGGRTVIPGQIPVSSRLVITFELER